MITANGVDSSGNNLKQPPHRTNASYVEVRPLPTNAAAQEQNCEDHPHHNNGNSNNLPRKHIVGQPRLPNGRFQSTRNTTSSSSSMHENDRTTGMMEYQNHQQQQQQHQHQQQQRAWLDHHYRSMYSSNQRSNSYSHASASSSSGNNANAASSSSVKFVNATPDSLESQIKREEMGPKKKRMRTTPEQLRILNKEFLTNSMPSSTARIQLAKRLGMSARAVQVWFQNRRAKAKLDAKRSGQSSPKQHSSSLHSGGHRRAYSHNALYSYPAVAAAGQRQGSLDDEYSEGEDDQQAGAFHSEHDSSGIGGALDEYLGGSTGGLFLDPSEMILLSPPIDQQKQRHPMSALSGRAISSASMSSSYHPHHQMIQTTTDDPIDHRQRLSPFEPVMLGEDFYSAAATAAGNASNRTNSLPMVSEFGGGGPGDELLPETVMLQDPVIPPPPPLMYYCNAFSTCSGGPALAGNNASAAFYYQPAPQPMLAPFFNSSSLINNNNGSGGSMNGNNMQKRSFSLPCIRPAMPSVGNGAESGAYYQHPGGPRLAEDEELLLGLGTHILEESEYRSNRSHSISEQF